MMKEKNYNDCSNLNLFFLIAIFFSSLLVNIKIPFGNFNYGIYNLLIPLFSLLLIVKNRHKFKEFFYFLKPIIIVTAIFYIWCWISAFLSPYQHIAFKYTLKYTSYFILFFAFLLSCYKTSQKQLHVQLKIILYFLFFLAIMGMVEYFFHDAKIFSLLRPKDSLSKYPEISSLMQNPNPFGVLMSIGLTLSIIMWKNKIIKFWKAIILIFFFVINITISASRNAWVVFILGVFLLYYYKIINFKNLLLLILLWIFFVLYFPVSVQKVGIENKLFPFAKWVSSIKAEKTKKLKIGKNRNKTNYIPKRKKTKKKKPKGSINNLIPKRIYASPGRIKLWKKAFVEFKTRPFAGIGIKVFDEIKSKEIGKKGCNTHDLFLNILIELGLIGFSLFLVLIYFTLKRIPFKEPICVIPIVLFFLAQIVDCFFYDFTFMILFFYFLSFCLTYNG